MAVSLRTEISIARAGGHSIVCRGTGLLAAETRRGNESGSNNH